MSADKGSLTHAEKIERSFSALQPVNDAVQKAESASPACCSRISLRLQCRAFERGYALELPLRTRKPNESPDAPPVNRRWHVMKAQAPTPLLQVLSVREGPGVAEVTLVTDGPHFCPPGVPNQILVEGIDGSARGVPETWQWQAPAVLDPVLLTGLEEEPIELLHPFKAAELPAQIWTVSAAHCPHSKLRACVVAFPDVRWQGKLTVKSAPDAGRKAGFVVAVEGDLACRYNGQTFVVATRDQARALSGWFDCVEMLAKSAAALVRLKPPRKDAGLDNPRLKKGGELRVEPWPRLSMTVESELFEQEGNGLLGHRLRVLAFGDPVMGVEGEENLLPGWLRDGPKQQLVAPLLVGLDAFDAAEVSQELGLWLVAQGRISLRAGLQARLPETPIEVMGRAAGRIDLGFEARSIREYDGFLIHSGGADDAAVPAGLAAVCEAPLSSPVPDLTAQKCKVAMAFAGCALESIEKWRPGCRFRRMTAGGEGKPAALKLLPARCWPPDSAPSKPVEVPWV